MPASKTMLTGGAFQDSLGNPLVNGTLKLHLSQDCLVAGVGLICSGIDITIQLDSAGNVASSTSTPPAADQFVWSNLVLSPQNNFYRVTGFTSLGLKAYGPNNQQVGSGATFNLDSWVPNTVISWFPPIQNLSLEVNGAQASSQVLQNLVEGAGIIITDEGSGVISFASSATLNVEVGGTPLSSTNPINFVAGTGIAVTNPSAGNVLITNTLPSGGFPGQWYGCTMAGATGSGWPGVNIGLDLVGIGGTTSPGLATATEGQFAKIEAGSTNSFGITDNFPGFGNGQPITLGILEDWFAKVSLVLVGGAGARFYVGVCDQGATSFTTVMTSDTPAANFVGFRYSTDVDGTTIKAICQTGASAQTIVDTGIPAFSGIHVFEIVPTAAGAVLEFFIDSGLVATIDTNVPPASLPLSTLICSDDLSNLGNTPSIFFWYVWMLLNY